MKLLTRRNSVSFAPSLSLSSSSASSYQTLCKSARRGSKKSEKIKNPSADVNITLANLRLQHKVIMETYEEPVHLTMDIGNGWASEIMISLTEGNWIIDALDVEGIITTFKANAYNDLLIYPNVIKQKRLINDFKQEKGNDKDKGRIEERIVEEVIASFKHSNT